MAAFRWVWEASVDFPFPHLPAERCGIRSLPAWHPVILSSFKFPLARGGHSNYSTFTKREEKATIKMMEGLNCIAIIFLRSRHAYPPYWRLCFWDYGSVMVLGYSLLETRYSIVVRNWALRSENVVTLGKWHNSSEPQLPHLLKEQWLSFVDTGGWTEKMYAKYSQPWKWWRRRGGDTDADDMVWYCDL